MQKALEKAGQEVHGGHQQSQRQGAFGHWDRGGG